MIRRIVVTAAALFLVALNAQAQEVELGPHPDKFVECKGVWQDRKHTMSEESIRQMQPDLLFFFDNAGKRGAIIQKGCKVILVEEVTNRPPEKKE